jgi:hypothetical protein
VTTVVVDRVGAASTALADTVLGPLGEALHGAMPANDPATQQLVLRPPPAARTAVLSVWKKAAFCGKEPTGAGAGAARETYRACRRIALAAKKEYEDYLPVRPRAARPLHTFLLL